MKAGFRQGQLSGLVSVPRWGESCWVCWRFGCFSGRGNKRGRRRRQRQQEARGRKPKEGGQNRRSTTSTRPKCSSRISRFLPKPGASHLLSRSGPSQGPPRWGACRAMSGAQGHRWSCQRGTVLGLTTRVQPGAISELQRHGRMESAFQEKLQASSSIGLFGRRDTLPPDQR